MEGRKPIIQKTSEGFVTACQYQAEREDIKSYFLGKKQINKQTNLYYAAIMQIVKEINTSILNISTALPAMPVGTFQKCAQRASGERLVFDSTVTAAQKLQVSNFNTHSWGFALSLCFLLAVWGVDAV